MPKVRMRDTTSLGSGPMLAGEVYDLAEDEADHLKKVGLASTAHADTETYFEKQAREQPADENSGPPMNPEIARQVAEAGTKEGDRATDTTPQRQPLNQPTANQPAANPRQEQQRGR